MYLPPATLDNLPSDVALTILGYLPPRDLAAVAATSRRYQQFAQDEYFWQRFVPAPPGRARRHYLREIAWRTSRPVCSITRQIDLPVRGVQVLSDSIALTCPLFSGLHPASLSRCPVATEPFVSVSHSPVDIRHLKSFVTGFDKIGARLLTASISSTGGSTHNCDVALHAASEADSLQGNGLRRVFYAQQTEVTAVGVGTDLSGKAGVLAGTRDGSVFIGHECGTLVALERFTEEIRAVSFTSDETALIGTSGGQVVHVDVGAGSRIGDFIGPCSCPVSAISASENGVVFAGIAHRVAGNGHSSLAVAWDARTSGRLASYGIGAFSGRSSAVLPPAVTSVRIGGSGRRLGLLAAGNVWVFDVSSWNTLLHSPFDGEAVAMDLNDERVAVFCQSSEKSGRLHVFDFGKAVDRMPDELQPFGPRNGR